MKTEYIKLRENTEVKVEEDTRFVLDFQVLSKKETKTQSFSVIFEKPGVTAEVLGVYKLSEGQKIDLQTQSIHKVSHTQCFVHIRGVLFDNSESNYIGKIIIEKKAQQTSSYLEDNVLVIGENTRNQAQPILEIEADDVKASHGATTGRIDPAQIFYLKSRGLSEEEAKSTIIEGFFDSLLGKIDDEKIKSEVKSKLNA